jgi:hypothetical protein
MVHIAWTARLLMGRRWCRGSQNSDELDLEFDDTIILCAPGGTVR